MTKLSVQLPFEGFYESSHDHVLDMWLEYEQDVLEQEHGATLEDLQKLADAFYSEVDWRAVRQHYARAYVDELQEKIFSEGGLQFSIEFEELQSPRFYNFETDRICAKIDRTALEAMLAAVPHEAWVAKVKEECTSRSGFISFYSADASEWEADIGEWGEARLGMILEAYLTHLGLGLEDLSGWDMMADYTGNGHLDSWIWGAASDDFKALAESMRKERAA